jgi:NMD protein affecting ribosome stability and mRNA decay|tara:strand:+ start:347 stop:796 length:450 start_codon:yes stop_codon:yes gene_type:complete
MGQNLFKSFVFEMSMEEAKKILAENSKILKNIPFGEETLYAVRKKSLVRKDGKLISIILGSKTNLNLKQAETYLKKSRAYFESEKFKMVYAQENWSNPVLVKKNLPGIRFVDPGKTVVVEVDPRGQESVYNVYVTFYNYNWFLKKARGE